MKYEFPPQRKYHKVRAEEVVMDYTRFIIRCLKAQWNVRVRLVRYLGVLDWLFDFCFDNPYWCQPLHIVSGGHCLALLTNEYEGVFTCMAPSIIRLLEEHHGELVKTFKKYPELHYQLGRQKIEVEKYWEPGERLSNPDIVEEYLARHQRGKK